MPRLRIPKPWVGLLLAGTCVWAGSGRSPLTESRVLEHEFSPPSRDEPVVLFIDNIFGSIEVEVASDARVTATIEEQIEARNASRLEAAKQEVKLDISEHGNEIEFYVDCPFRERNGSGFRYRDPGYQVYYDFVVRVPRETHVNVRTINDGSIRVTGVSGRFEVANVNGTVTLSDIAGSGRATTVNGAVRVGFVENPEQDCGFETVNGDVDVRFADDLHADLRMKTMHGDLLSEFEVTPLPAREIERSTHGGKTMIRADRWASVRVGAGGPTLTFETLNGDVLIRREGR